MCDQAEGGSAEMVDHARGEETPLTLATEVNMRAQIAVSVILAGSLLGSAPMAVAQTGEFAASVPAEVVRAGQRLQDELQAARSRKTSSRTDRAYGPENSGKPQDGIAATDGITTGREASRWK